MTTTRTDNLPPRSELRSASLRLKWAVPLIRRGRAVGDLPLYGSPQFNALPDSDVRRIAATVVAAECQARDTDHAVMRQRLEDEITVRRQIAAKEQEANDAAEDREWRRVASNVVSIATARTRAPWETRERRGGQ